MIFLSIFIIYIWVSMYNIPKNINKHHILVLSFLGVTCLVYLTKLFVLFYKNANMKIKKIYFWLSVVLELVFIYLI